MQVDNTIKISPILNEAEKTNQDLIKLILDREIFLHTLSHDLRGPVNNIEGISELLKESVENSDINEIKSLMGYLQQSVTSMGAMIANLTDLGKLNDKNLCTNEDVLLPDLMEEVIQLLNEKYKINIQNFTNYQFENDRIFSCKKNLRTILYSVLSNSITHQNSNIPLKIEVLSELIDNEVIFSIKDNGKGITDEDLENVFIRPSKNSIPIKSNTGLNLYSTSKLIELENGKMTIHRLEPNGLEILFKFKRKLPVSN